VRRACLAGEMDGDWPGGARQLRHAATAGAASPMTTMSPTGASPEGSAVLRRGPLAPLPASTPLALVMTAPGAGVAAIVLALGGRRQARGR
jgi:hypothetical protein